MVAGLQLVPRRYVPMESMSRTWVFPPKLQPKFVSLEGNEVGVWCGWCVGVVCCVVWCGAVLRCDVVLCGVVYWCWCSVLVCWCVGVVGCMKCFLLVQCIVISFLYTFVVIPFFVKMCFTSKKH